MSEPRTIRFTDAAKTDLLWMRVTRDEWNIIKAELKRIAAVHNVNADSAVCRIAQCDDELMRLKLHDPNVRIAFTVEDADTVIVVRAIVRRGERTYDMIEILFRAQVA